MDVVIRLIPIMIRFFIEIWTAFRQQTSPSVTKFCECNHRENQHYWNMDGKGCDQRGCSCTGFVFLHDQYEDDLDIMRRRLEESNRQVQSVNVSSDEYQRVRYGTPPSGGSNVTPPPPPRVNPAPWYVPEQVHANGGRAVKLPKKDESCH